MLSLVATPIGNLKDITYRAIEVLSGCDLILCEDTRRTAILLQAYQIKKPLKSYHKFSEAKHQQWIVDALEKGTHIALVSDAGTPAIADPGVRLVKRVQEEGLAIEVIPGPCALIAALSISGLPTHPFQFLGFLPKKKGQLEKLLTKALEYDGTTVVYESPFRLLKVLEMLKMLDASRQIAVARELTKKFEELKKGTAEELITHYTKKPPKGEIVILI